MTKRGEIMAKTTKIQIIYPNCWKCGKVFSLPERDYNHGASCGKC
jgi:hypothetical protein